MKYMNGKIYKFNSILIIFHFVQHVGRYKYYVKCNIGEQTEDPDFNY